MVFGSYLHVSTQMEENSNASEQHSHYFHHGNYAQITSKQSQLLYVHKNKVK
jgi:hypothetical protein